MLRLFCLPRPQDGFSALLRRHGGSRRNSLLRWCQSRTQGYEVREEKSSQSVKLPVYPLYLVFIAHVFCGRILRSQTSAAAGRTAWCSVLFITLICQVTFHMTPSTQQTRYDYWCLMSKQKKHM